MYFPLVNHLVQELNDRLLSQENRFLGQYLAPAKLNDLTAEYKISFMKPTKPILKRRETRWQTKWFHLTDEKPVTCTLTERHSSMQVNPGGPLSHRGDNYYHPPDNASVN